MIVQESLIIDSEKAVIGSVLIKNEIMDEIGSILEPYDFMDPIHEIIWKAIDHMYRNDKEINSVSLTEMLTKYDRLREISGGFEYIHHLISNVLTTEESGYHAKLIKKYSIRRRSSNVGEKIKQLASEYFDEEEEFYQEVEKLADSIRTNKAEKISSFKDIIGEYENYMITKEDYISTGFGPFDNWAKGIGRGWLYILAARPSLGKTAKMLSMATHIAKQDLGAVIIFSQEMKKEALMNRILANMTAIPLSRFRRKELETIELGKVKEGLNQLQDLPLYILDRGAYSIDQVRSISRQIKRKHGKLAAIFVDYLGIMDIPIRPGQTYAQAVGAVSSKAKSIAMELDCVFVMLSQLNREVEKSTKPSLSHLRDSGSIEQDADVVEFLWHDPKDSEGDDNPLERIIYSTIAKGRDIGLNQFKYIFKGWNQQFKALPKKND